MVRTGSVEYDGCVAIVIGVDMMVYIAISASVIVIIIIVVIIFYRDVVLISLVFVWIGG